MRKRPQESRLPIGVLRSEMSPHLEVAKRTYERSEHSEKNFYEFYSKINEFFTKGGDRGEELVVKKFGLDLYEYQKLIEEPLDQDRIANLVLAKAKFFQTAISISYFLFGFNWKAFWFGEEVQIPPILPEEKKYIKKILLEEWRKKFPSEDKILKNSPDWLIQKLLEEDFENLGSLPENWITKILSEEDEWSPFIIKEIVKTAEQPKYITSNIEGKIMKRVFEPEEERETKRKEAEKKIETSLIENALYGNPTRSIESEVQKVETRKYKRPTKNSAGKIIEKNFKGWEPAAEPIREVEPEVLEDIKISYYYEYELSKFKDVIFSDSKVFRKEESRLWEIFLYKIPFESWHRNLIRIKPFFRSFQLEQFQLFVYWSVWQYGGHLERFNVLNFQSHAENETLLKFTFFWWMPDVFSLTKELERCYELLKLWREFSEKYEEEEPLFLNWRSWAKNPYITLSGVYKNSLPRYLYSVNLSKKTSHLIPMEKKEIKKFLERESAENYIDWQSWMIFSGLIWLSNSQAGLFLAVWFRERRIRFKDARFWRDIEPHKALVSNLSCRTEFRQTSDEMHIKWSLPPAWAHNISLYSLFQHINLFSFSGPQELQTIFGEALGIVEYIAARQIIHFKTVFKSWLESKTQEELDFYFKDLEEIGNLEEETASFSIRSVSVTGESFLLQSFSYPVLEFQEEAFLNLRDIANYIAPEMLEASTAETRQWKENWILYSIPHYLRIIEFENFVYNNNLMSLSCFEQFNAYCEFKNLPQILIPLREFNDIQRFKLWALENGFGFFMEGYPSFNEKESNENKILYLSPTHIDIVEPAIFTKKKNNIKGLIKIYYEREAKYNFLKDPRENFLVHNLEWEPGISIPFESLEERREILSFRKNSITIDFECTAVEEQPQIPYCVCVTGYIKKDALYVEAVFSNIETSLKLISATGEVEERKEEKDFEEISNETCIENFVEWLAEISTNYSREEPLFIYSFNGFRYEMVFLYVKLIKRFGRVDSLGPPRESRGFSLNGGSILFIDVCKLVPGVSLAEACKNFKTIVEKESKESIDIAEMVEWPKIIENYEKIKEYCIRDCVATFLLVEKIYLNIASLYKGKVSPESLKRFSTAPSLAWDYWFSMFFKKSLANKFLEEGEYGGNIKVLNIEPIEVYKLQRENYFGGIVQVYKNIVEEEIFPLDVNSMYPWQMYSKEMPFYFKGEIKKEELLLSLDEYKSELNFYELDAFEFPKDYGFNFIAVKIPKRPRNEFPASYFSPRGRIGVWGHLLKKLKEIKGNFNILRGWRYRSEGETSLKDFVEELYTSRKRAKEEKNEALSTVLKLLMNSLTGRLSMKERMEGYSSIFRGIPEDCEFEIGEEKWLGDFTIYEGVKNLPEPGRLVRITSYITSFSKLDLANFAEKVGLGNFFYSDTDSIYVSKKAYILLGEPKSSESELGKLKLELKPSEKIVGGYFFSRKFYILKYENGEYKAKTKGIPAKYMNNEICANLVELLKKKIHLLSEIPWGESVLLTENEEEKIKIKIWRRNYFDEKVVINAMSKNVSILNDRFYLESFTLGRTLGRFRFQHEDESQGIYRENEESSDSSKECE